MDMEWISQDMFKGECFESYDMLINKNANTWNEY